MNFGTWFENNKLWKQIFWTLSTIILVLMPLLSHSYGQSGDEWVQIVYGQDIWNYFFKDSKQALDYSNMSLQFQKQELYGGLFDFPMTILHSWFPSISLLTLRHFFNALSGALLMLFTGLLTKRLSGKWFLGALALLFIFFSPRIFGESMNNPKDIPFAAGFIIGSYAVIAFLQDFPKHNLRNAVLIALGWGIAFGIRSAGGMLLGAYFVFFIGLYYILHKSFRDSLQADGNKLLKQFIIYFIAAIIGGYIIGLSAWPWGLQSPISNPLISLKEMTNRDVVLRVLFEGEYRPNSNMPWYYEFKWILMTNPVIVVVGVALFILLFAKVKQQYGWFVLIVPAFAAFFPLLYMIYKHSSVHDTWRHVFFVYPFWVALSALGFDAAVTTIKNQKLKAIPFVIAFIGLLPMVVWAVRTHPNQYVYFNEFVGGVEGAYGYYDIDYYQNSGKQAADWIIKNAPHVAGRRVTVLSNMANFERYFERDTTWAWGTYGRYTERHHLDWDYYVAYPRYIPAEQMQNNKWILQNTVHTVSVNGVPLCVVVKNKSKAGIVAYDALEKKDFALAAQKYGEYIRTDNTDEYALINYGISLASIGQLDQALQALNRAAELNSSMPEVYDLLGKIYNAKGDAANAQKAQQTMNDLVMQQQELAGE